MATADKLQDDFLTCNLCMQVYQEPLTLACQHSFCRTCVGKYLQTKTEAVINKTIPCPTCRRETPVPHPDRPVEDWVGQLKSGLLRTGLMESVVVDSRHCSMCLEEGKTTPASIWCVDCQACLCEECLKLHNKVAITKNHDVSKLTEGKQQKLKKPFVCVNHEKKIKLFCNNCKKSLCAVCFSISHRKCEDVVTIKDMLPEVTGQLMKRQEKLAEATERRHLEIVKCGEKVDKFLMKSASVKSDITKTIQAAVNYLREKETELLEKLDVQTNQKAEKLRSKMKTKETETQMYQQQSQSIQQALELEDEAQLFEMYLSSGTRPVEDITLTRREGTTDIADINFIHDIDNLKIEVSRMDVRFNDNKIDLATTPILTEVIDVNVEGTNSCDVRDVVVMDMSDMKVTVFADYSGNNLKSVHQSSSILSVSGYPWCIAVTGERKVAVTLTDTNHIIIVAVTPDLKVLLTIQTSKTYKGLSTRDHSTLVVGSESPPSVDLIDMQGNIMKTFTTLPTIGKSFSNPSYIHIHTYWRQSTEGSIWINNHQYRRHSSG